MKKINTMKTVPACNPVYCDDRPLRFGRQLELTLRANFIGAICP
jgi:hypothetical protein